VTGARLHVTSMLDTPNIKPDARRLVDSLPDSATWDDLAYEVYVREAMRPDLPMLMQAALYRTRKRWRRSVVAFVARRDSRAPLDGARGEPTRRNRRVHQCCAPRCHLSTPTR
jgi:hypothetical protein